VNCNCKKTAGSVESVLLLADFCPPSSLQINLKKKKFRIIIFNWQPAQCSSPTRAKEDFPANLARNQFRLIRQILATLPADILANLPKTEKNRNLKKSFFRRSSVLARLKLKCKYECCVIFQYRFM
jgi:hypothetical protein